MKFIALAATTLFALASAGGKPVPSDLTVEQASAACGDKAQLSCCNSADYSGKLTKVQQGIAAGLLNDVLGGSGDSQGLGLFKQCAGISVVGLLNDQCQQNVACCSQSGSSADGNLVGASLPCIDIGSVL
ncbi:rodlet peptide [Aspergillus unguis]